MIYLDFGRIIVENEKDFIPLEAMKMAVIFGAEHAALRDVERPHYEEDCPWPARCPAHWDTSPTGRYISGLFGGFGI